MKFFEELKRRNVIRVAGLYGVVGWLLAQAASLMENALALPKWFDAVVVSLLLIGFPLAVVFAWVFEMTPEGLKRTAEVPQDASIAPKTGKKLDYALLGAVALLIVVIIADRFIAPRGAAAPAKVAEAAASAAGTGAAGTGADAVEADNSIAVLPFTDMSSEKDQEYFSDGISEELLNVLAQVPGLRVAGRTSSFAFKGQNKDLREIGEVLNVGHIVEGSIRKSGNKVRITAQLIKAKDGYHQWSQTYDRELTDIFAVQDEIAKAIVSEMSGALPALAQASGEIKPVARADIGAYDLYLLAREKMTQIGSRAAYLEASKLLDDAIAQDPHYAPALAWRAYAETMLSDIPGGVGNKPASEALPVIKDYADRAIAEDPASPEALFALGSYYGQLSYTEGLSYLPRTIETLRAAVAIRPNFPQAQNDLAYFLNLSGDRGAAMEILGDVLANDPGLRDANVTYSYGLIGLGRYEEAEAALQRWARIRPNNRDERVMHLPLLMAQGRLADAARESDRLQGEDEDLQTRIKLMQSALNWMLRDGAKLLADERDERKAIGALFQGDRKRAIELVDKDSKARLNSGEAMGSYIPVHYYAGDAKGAAAYYDAEIKAAAAIEAAHYCECTPLALILSLKDTGHKDFRPMLDAWKRDASSRRELFARSAAWNADMGDISALEGDFAAAKRSYAAAIDYGWRNPYFISRDYRNYLPRDAEFDALLARMTSLINEERHKLGMPPIDVAKG